MSVTNDVNSPDMNGDFEEIRIEVPWGHIAGKWWGPKNVQPILAMHGWQDNAGTFDTLAPRLITPDLSVLSIDLPGHGFSSHYPAGQYYYIFWGPLVCVRRIVKHFKWDKVSIMGHSLGGSIGFLYAAIYPNEIDKYIALDIHAPVVIETINDLGKHIDTFLKYEIENVHKKYNWNYKDMLDIVEDSYKHSLTRRSCEIMMKRGIKNLEEDKSLYTFCRDVRLRFSKIGLLTNDEIYEYASRITCKVLNIRADSGIFSDKIDFYESVINKIKTSASAVEYHHVPGSHHVHLNNPEQVSGIIAKFLKS